MTSYFQDGWTKSDMEEAILRDNPEELLYVPAWVSMDPPDCKWAEDICIKLSVHENFNVRGNAILGFGHLARTCGSLNLEVVAPIVSSALNDSSAYVKGHAHTAKEDIEHFMKSGVFKNA